MAHASESYDSKAEPSTDDAPPRLRDRLRHIGRMFHRPTRSAPMRHDEPAPGEHGASNRLDRPVKKTSATESDYFLAAASWETNEVVRARRAERRAWIVAGLATVVAIASVGAVSMLTPLKTVEPYVIRVDNSTGVVDIVRSLRDAKSTYEEEVNKFFLIRYVRAREAYARPIAETNYIAVGLMSAPGVAQRYQEFFNPQNPGSPLNTLGEAGHIDIKVKSVAFLNERVASIRYARMERDDSLATTLPRTTHWVATVTFHYVRAPMSQSDREVNPLGFQVVDYRADPESLTEVRAGRGTESGTDTRVEARR